jgi:uncharacterized protein (UPF0297 family)
MIYFPTYNRGESIVGYTQRCSSNRNLIRVVEEQSVRIELCKDFLREQRKVLNQPFSKGSDKKK